MSDALEDTITAISTPPGEGGVGIVRLSGPRALEIAAQCFVSSRGRAIQPPGQRVFHGHIHDATGRVLDEVLLHVMRGPHSYTAEDVVEINAHGGAAPLRAILDECLCLGARLAQPGEFTKRAFLNGRIDLSRAEAVCALIQSKTRAAMNVANLAADGGLTQAIYELRDTLTDALARIEAAVDFPEEDLPELVNDELFARLRVSLERMRELERNADAGILYQEGVSIAIVGKPNVGKSSLFNALLRDARAIVSAQPGTTRDRIEATITLEGIPTQLVDTAGLRSADNEVEIIGVERARDAARRAGMLLFVVNAAEPYAPEDLGLARELGGLDAPMVLVRNKCDLPNAAELIRQPAPTGCTFAAICDVSALTGEGLRTLEHRLAALLLEDVFLSTDSPMLFRAHQKNSMRCAAENVAHLLKQKNASPEFLAMDLREALQSLGEITGETTPEDVLDRIFNAFCIGK